MTKLLFIDRIRSIIPFIKSKKNLYCADCSKKKIITEPENKYSKYNFGRPLCRKHQTIVLNKTTPEAKKLFKELKKQGIGECTLELFDGFKTVDISIEWAGLDIEVDGKQHLLDSKQLFTDIIRAHYSKENDNFETIHIPNNLINDNVKELAGSIIEVAKKRYGQSMKVDSFKNIISKIVPLLVLSYVCYLWWIGVFLIKDILFNFIGN